MMINHSSSFLSTHKTFRGSETLKVLSIFASLLILC